MFGVYAVSAYMLINKEIHGISSFFSLAQSHASTHMRAYGSPPMINISMDMNKGSDACAQAAHIITKNKVS